MIRLLVFLLLAVSTAAASGATCTSRRDGNWSSSNTWNCGSGSSNGPPAVGDAVVVRGSDSVTLNTNSNSLSSLTVNSGGSISGDSNSRTIYLAGNLSNSGTISIQGGSSSRIVLQGASTWSGDGTVLLDYLDINWNALTLDSASSAVIHLTDSDPFQNVGGFNNSGSPNRVATVYLDGGGQSYNDYNIQMPNLVVSGGTKTVSSSSFVVLGNLTINSGATLGTDAVSTVTLGGDLTINGTLSSFSGGSTTWTFNGSATQHISAAAAFRNVTLNNSNGLVIDGDLTVGDSSWGTLTLSAGKLTTGSNAVIIPKNCSGSMISRVAGTWINGNQRLTMPSYNATCIFDVGDSSNYAPITFAYPWHSGPLGGTVTGGTTSGDHPDTTAGTSGVDSAKSVNRYWVLAAGGSSTFYTYDATFQYCNASGSANCAVNDVDAAATPSNFVVGEKASGAWSVLTPTVPSASSRMVSGATTFGAFAIGQAGATVPNNCPQPTNTPAGLTLTCQCDSFGRSALNPSPMFTSSNWIVSTSDSTGIVPYVNSSSGFLRLTENTGNNAKAATAPGFFPAAGNYISVEFKHYAYNGSGADGIAMALSDYTVPAVPGAFGGSLGYAQKTSGGVASGFAGGWIGVAVDEYGNFSNPNEGRVGGIGFIRDGVAVRGSGSGTTGYPYLGGTSSSLTPGVDNAGSTSPAYGHYYQIIVDARNSALGQTWVAVNRDTSGSGASYSSVVPTFNAYAAASAAGYTQAPVPANWQLSFTGSTGGSTNIHELGQVRICAQYYVPPDGGTAGGFSAIDEAYSSSVQNFQTGHIYTKLAGTPFKLKLAALSNSQIQTTYAASGTKTVTVKLVDNSDGLCGDDSSRASACATNACNGKSAISGGSQSLTFNSSDKGVKTSGNFTVNSAYSRLVAVISDGTTTACSIDGFAVRPTLLSGVASSASNATLAGSPKFKANTDSFTLSVSANASGYTGQAKINTAAMAANTAAWVLGAISPSTFPNAVSGSSSSTASGSFLYSEVGNFRFLGYDPATDTTSQRGIYDDDWVTIDSAATKNDCVAGSYSNAKDASGKYGCSFGLSETGTSAPNSAWFGRFVPDRFVYLGGSILQFCSAPTPFTYMGQPAIGIAYRLQATNGSGAVTSNYSQSLGYPVVNPALVAEDQAVTHQGCDLASRIGGLASGQWSNGLFVLNDADANSVPDSASATFSMPAATPVALTAATCAATRNNAGGPFWLLDIGVAMNDTDAGAVLAAADMDAASAGLCSGTGCSARKLGTTGVLDGRLQLSNAYGSELLPLSVPIKLQYWTSAGWTMNSADSCTFLTVPTNGNSGLTNTVATKTTALLNAPVQSGDTKFRLTAPGAGNAGLVDISGTILRGANSWLTLSAPSARACFGVCGPRSPVIYFRERY